MPKASICLVFLFSMSVCATEKVASNWLLEGLIDWRTHEFDGTTDYSLTDHSGSKVVRAKARNSASSLYRNIKVDINQTPIINWSWMASYFKGDGLERTKAGDDFVVRLYVVASTGPMPWQKSSLVYVISRDEPVGSYWPNPFTQRAIIYVVDTYDSVRGRWVNHKADIKKDFKRYFNKDIDIIDGIALMTDTDNSGGEAVAYYGDIYFSED